MIHAECRDTPRNYSDKHYQTVWISDVKTNVAKRSKKGRSACLQSERKDIFVDKKLSLSHFLGNKN